MSFEVISKEEWLKAETKFTAEHEYVSAVLYEELEMYLMPSRSTPYSAGYDFKSPYAIEIKANTNYLFPTGMKCNFDSIKLDDKHPASHIFLALYPRSSYGFKYGFQLLNTVGVIDYDYYNNPDNEGHIMVGFRSEKDFSLRVGDKFCQGIFQLYTIDMNEKLPTEKRTGGIGSTGK